jgi:predicted MFS family arabinose efflux permease
MTGFNQIEKKAALSIAVLISLRMYGLFLIMPVFSVYAQNYSGSTPFLVGLALGIYGLTQAMFQIPLGLASDFFGRKKILTLGLLIFIIGSVIAALSTSMTMVVIGRAIQGMGAIASTGMALVADVSRPEQRTKMMAIVGSSIGLAFILAFITGPIFSGWFGIAGLFWITAGLASLALIQLLVFVEEPKKHTKKAFSFTEFLHTFKDSKLMSLNVSVFVLHAVMTALFLVLPLILVEKLGFEIQDHWKMYLPVLVLSIFLFVPMIIINEKKKQYFSFISFALFGLALSQLLIATFNSSLIFISAMLVIYFAFFNFLEASMPALLSRISGEKYRGAAMGGYSTSQFLGAFVGSALAGVLMSYGYLTVFYAMAGLIVFCLIIVLFASRK